MLDLNPTQTKFLQLTKRVNGFAYVDVTPTQVIGICGYALFIVNHDNAPDVCGHYDADFVRTDNRIPYYQRQLDRVPLSFTTPTCLELNELVTARTKKWSNKSPDLMTILTLHSGEAVAVPELSNVAQTFDRNLICPALKLMKRITYHSPYFTNLPAYFSCAVTGCTLFAMPYHNDASTRILNRDLCADYPYPKDFSIHEYTYLFAQLDKEKYETYP